MSDDLNVSLADVRPLFGLKTEVKGIAASSFPDRFEDRVGRYKRRWETEMSEHLGDVPRFEDVVRTVRRHLRSAGLLNS